MRKSPPFPHQMYAILMYVKPIIGERLALLAIQMNVFLCEFCAIFCLITNKAGQKKTKKIIISMEMIVGVNVSVIKRIIY